MISVMDEVAVLADQPKADQEGDMALVAVLPDFVADHSLLVSGAAIFAGSFGPFEDRPPDATVPKRAGNGSVDALPKEGPKNKFRNQLVHVPSSWCGGLSRCRRMPNGLEMSRPASSWNLS